MVIKISLQCFHGLHSVSHIGLIEKEKALKNTTSAKAVDA